MRVIDNRNKGPKQIGNCRFGSVVKTPDGICVVTDIVETYTVVAVRLKDGKGFTYQMSEQVTELIATVTIDKEV